MQSGSYLRIPSRVVSGAWCALAEGSGAMEAPAGFCALSSDGPLSLGFTLSKKLSDTFLEVLQFEFEKDPMGASGRARHPQTTLVVPISRERYV